MPRDDDRLAQASRALRHRAGLTQADVVRPGRSRYIPRLIEDGRAGELRLNEIRGYFERLGGRMRVSAWLEGAILDRLIDADHAPVVDAGISTLLAYGWTRATSFVTRISALFALRGVPFD